MRDQFATFFGPTPMIDADGAFHQEVLATASAKIFQSNSTTLMA